MTKLKASYFLWPICALAFMGAPSSSLANPLLDTFIDKVASALEVGKCPDLSGYTHAELSVTLTYMDWNERDLEKNEILKALGERIAAKGSFTLAKADWSEFKFLPRHDRTRSHALKLVSVGQEPRLFLFEPFMPPVTCFWSEDL